MPLVTQDLVYIHMPKTGGTWVANVLLKLLQAKQVGDGHGPSMPGEGRVVFGTVRDPWTWYVSWWLHALRANPDTACQWGNGSPAFSHVLQGVLYPHTVDKLPQEFGVCFPISPRGIDQRLSLLQSGQSLYSWLFHHLYGDHVNTLIDIGQLRQGLESVTGLELPEEDWPPMNVGNSLHKGAWHHITSYVEEVRRIDRKALNILGYEGPGGKLPTPVITL